MAAKVERSGRSGLNLAAIDGTVIDQLPQRWDGLLEQSRPPDPLHAIDEPAVHASTRIHPSPAVSAGQPADINELMPGSVRRCMS
jgi:hypothetical protein